jgi:hypothetical protein
MAQAPFCCRQRMQAYGSICAAATATKQALICLLHLTTGGWTMMGWSRWQYDTHWFCHSMLLGVC